MHPPNQGKYNRVFEELLKCLEDLKKSDDWFERDVLENIIHSCKNSNRLGEVALVEYDSSISKSGIVFYETLFDENASCHLALGAAFPECIKKGTTMSKEELDQSKLNDCTNHVDFMIGTKDLKITGTTFDGEEIVIFDNGNFSEAIK